MNFYQRLIAQVSELTRTVGNLVHVGTVHEVNGEKLRMVLGSDKDGKDVLSPWLNSIMFRGGARESRFFKKGQNLAVLMPGGDPRQGILLPFAPNKNFLRPDHSNGKGQDEETYQLDDLRIRKTKEGYEFWLQPARKQQQHGELKELPKHKSDASGQASMKVRMNKNGGITGRVGKMRFMAHKDGAKIKAERQYVVVTKRDIIMSKPPIIAKDPIPDDDK